MLERNLKLSYFGATKTEDGIGLASKLHLNALRTNKLSEKLGLSIKEYILSRDVGYQNNLKLINKITMRHLNNEDSQINYFHFSPRWIDKYLGKDEKRYLNQKINIGYWVCEAQKIPKEWTRNIDFFDEIWTSSDFCKKVYQNYLEIPINVIHHPVLKKPISKRLINRYNKIEDKTFTFLTIANAFSDLKRKNSVSVVKAFKLAFKSNDKKVRLIIKLTNTKDDLQEYNQIISLIKDYKNIHLISEHCTSEDILKLYQLSDAYVSLHRSEGFGLTISDAYSLGIPVIATGYSGNLDILCKNPNSLLVDYELINVGEKRLRYYPDDIWAEPDINSAKEKMIRVREDFNTCFDEAFKVRMNLRKTFNPDIIGAKMIKRLSSLSSKK